MRGPYRIIPQFLVLSLIVVLAACSWQARRAVHKSFHHQFLEPEIMQNHFKGFLLYDPETDTEIYNYQAEHYFTPASNAKLLAFYTATQIMGDSVPTFAYSYKGDSLIIKPLGDPTFLHKDFLNQPADSFLRFHKGPILVDFSADQIIPWAPGWTWEDYYYPFAAERSIFPIYGNLSSIYLPVNNQSPYIRPKYFPLSEQSGSRVMRERFNNQFFYPSQLLGSGWEVQIPFRSSQQLVLDLLADTLHQSVGNWSGGKVAYQEVFHSRPMDSLYLYLLHNSDNFFSEQLLIMCAALKWDQVSSEKMIRFSQDSILHFLPDAPRWVDGAGLSRYNLVSPRDLGQILDHLYEEMDTSRLFALFPAGGVSGTLERFYAGENGPYVFAKTGTLSNNHNLSGYIKTHKGRVLIFSLMQNHYPYSSSVVKPHIEKVLQTVYENY